MRSDLVFQTSGDVDAPGPGIDGLDRAKEPVGLEDKLAAQPVLVVDDDGFDAALSQFAGPRIVRPDRRR